MADGSNVGTVKGTVELEDRMSTAVDLLEGKIKSLDDRFGGLGSRLAETTASFFTAEAALDAVKEAGHLVAETLQEITIEGSHAADIEGTFEHLTEKAGLLGDVLLDKTRAGLHGTVTDMDIMTRVNQNLSVGLNLTSDQMNTLSQGAFTLAKATGGDVAGAMDKLSDAMVTGRTRSIALLTGKIDLAAAEDAYAAKLGVTSDHLSEQGKQAAIQQAILEKVASATDRIGDVQERLADKIQQVKVEFSNFEEELGTAIATSPVVAAGFDGIRTAIEGAFGGQQGEAVKTISHYVDDFAIRLIDAAETGVNAGAVLGQEWNATKVVFGDIIQIVDGDILVFKYLAEGIAEVGKALHIPGAAEEVSRIDTEIQTLMETMVERGKALQEDKKAEDDWATSSGKVIDTLEGIKAKMVAAQKAEGEFTDVVRDNKTAHDGASASADKHGASEAKVGMTIAMTKEEIKKYNEAWTNLNSLGTTWEDTLKTISPELVKTIEYYLEAGASVENLAAAYPELTKAQIESVKALEQNAKVEAEAAATLTQMYSDYYSKKGQLYATDTQKAILAADADYQKHVEDLSKKGVQDVEYYNELWDLRNKDVKLADSQRLLADTNSKASLEKAIDDAKDKLDFMHKYYDQYTDADRDAQASVISNLQKQHDAWGQVGSQIGAVGRDGTRVFDMLSQANAAFMAGMDSSKIKVKLLDDEIVSLDEAQKRFNAGGSFTYDLTTRAGVEQYRSMNTGMNITWTDEQLMAFAQKGGTLQQLMQMGVISMKGLTNQMPSFAEGGAGDFGSGTLAMLHGKEIITPIDKVGAGTNLTFNVNGTAVQVAQQIKDIIMRELKSMHQF